MVGPRTFLVFLSVLTLTTLATLSGVDANRHRHRRDPSPVVLGSDVFAPREEQQENKHKPDFKRCDDYRPEVAEESPTGKRHFYPKMVSLFYFSAVSFRFFAGEN